MINRVNYCCHVMCDVCEAEIITIVKNSLTCSTNIMLNDYTIAQSDVSATKKKKISTFS